MDAETFAVMITRMSKVDLIETIRQDANALAKNGVTYRAAMLREIANRYEACRDL